MAAHFFTSRAGGVSIGPYADNNLAFHVGDAAQAVAENRLRLQQTLGMTMFMNQSHGDAVAVIESWTAHEPNADAMVTQVPGLFIGVLVADCLPLLMWDEEGACVAAVHVGRRGLVNRIAVKTVGVMQALGAEKISAVIGPAICGRCYEVGEDVYSATSEANPTARSRTAAGTLALDIPAALEAQLLSLGVESARSHECTVESESLFSFRRDGVTGRFAGVISL